MKIKRLQYRDINSEIVSAVYEYTLDKNIKQGNKLFDILYILRLYIDNKDDLK